MTVKERLKESLANRWGELVKDEAEIMPKLIDYLLAVANKYGVKWEDVAEHFAETLYHLATASTFEHFEGGD